MHHAVRSKYYSTKLESKPVSEQNRTAAHSNAMLDIGHRQRSQFRVTLRRTSDAGVRDKGPFIRVVGDFMGSICLTGRQ